MYFSDDELLYIKNNMELFYKICDVNCMLIDDQGEIVHKVGADFHFCELFVKSTKEKCPCQGAHLYGSKEAENLGEAYIFFCPGGLVHISAAIVIGEVFKGALIAGPLQMGISDPYIIDNLIKVYNLPVTIRGILQLNYKAIPTISPEKTRYIAGLLDIICRDIIGEKNYIIRKKKEFYDEQRIMSENLQSIKSESKINKSYPIELENELSSRIIRGDFAGAKGILNELLGYIMFTHGGDRDKVVSLIIELVVVMSRAAVKGGADYNRIFEQNIAFYSGAHDVKSTEELCMWIVGILEKFIELVFNVNSDNVDNVKIINKVMHYINENFRTNISLDEISSYVGLSPAYFSRFFKKETQFKFVDYINIVRVEESKKYLLDSDYSLSDIAVAVGFSDQSYFSKVFKNIEKISPGKYRKMYL